MEVAQNFRASCESYTDGKDRLKYWVDNISEVMASCSVEHHAKLLNPLMCGEITIRDIVKVFSASFPCFEEKNPKLGERMMRALYQTGKCTNFAAFWAMWTRISWRLNRKGEASKICEQGFKMELDDESFLRRAQKLLMEEQGDRIEYALREQTKSRVLGSVENVTKENKEQTVALLKLNNIEANVNAVLQKVEKLETHSTRIYSFLEAFEERLGRIEATASRIEESKHVAFKSEDSVVKDRKNNVLINLANEFSGDQDSSFIQLMSNSKADFTPADPTEVSQTAILDANNLITFSPATDLENIPPPPCDKPERKSKVGFACKPFKASQGQSKENEQPKLIPHRAQESVGVDLNATELEAAITEYETEFKQRLENPVSVAQTRNLLNGTEIEAAITEYETKFQQKFQNLACASQASKNWLSDTFYVGVGTIADNQREVGSHSASVKPQSSEHNVIPSDDSLSHILQEESMSTGSQPELPTEKSSKQEMAVENVKAAALLSFEHLLVDVTKAEEYAF